MNADDFGFTPDVNEGIVEGYRRGILTAATLMANGDAFEDAVRRAKDAPALDIGCHLVLIGGHSLTNGKALPRSVPQLLSALARREIRVEQELSAQIRHIVSAGLRPTHLDTHKHTHLAPPVLDAVARLSQEFGIRWVRRPFDFPMTNSHGTAPRLKRLISSALRVQRGRFHRVLQAHGCRTTDHFAGFQITGRFRTAQLVALLAELPEGSTEFMCHPGKCGAALRRASTRLKESREAELEALIAPEVRDAMERHGIQLLSYRDL
ncbi:MAG TPA: ChbG/HpnK family deacetylase [Bryobacteraceae bacterium]|nr:ChbG/HpnK family deacetylase [Bryobacteraceae bacterium]